MSNTPEPQKPGLPSEVLSTNELPPNAGRGGYNDSPNHTVTASSSTVPTPDHPSYGGRGGCSVTPGSEISEHPQNVPYPPPNTYLEQPEHPTFRSRSGYNISPQSQAPIQAFAKARHSPTSEQENGGFGGRGGYNAGAGPTPAPEVARSPAFVPKVVVSPHTASRKTQSFAEYEAEHSHGAGLRKSSQQEGSEHGFSGRSGHNAGTAGPAQPFGPPHHAATFAEYEQEHGHGMVSPNGSVQSAPEHGFGGRGGYNADINPALSPPGPFNVHHRALTFAEYEAQHEHESHARRTALQDAPEHGFGGRGGYNASVSGKASPSPEGPFGAPHRTQTFAEYEAEHGRPSASRNASVQESPEHGFGGRGGYNANVNPGGALSPEAPFSAPRRAQTFEEYKAEHGLVASMRKASLQEAPEHGFGGRGGYNANVNPGGAPSSEAPFTAPHRAQTFSDYEKELGHGTEVRKGIVTRTVDDHDPRSRGHSPPEEAHDRPGFGGRGGYNERPPGLEGHEQEHRIPEQDKPGHPGFGGRGG